MLISDHCLGPCRVPRNKEDSVSLQQKEVSEVCSLISGYCSDTSPDSSSPYGGCNSQQQTAHCPAESGYCFDTSPATANSKQHIVQHCYRLLPDRSPDSSSPSGGCNSQQQTAHCPAESGYCFDTSPATANSKQHIVQHCYRLLPRHVTRFLLTIW